MRVRWSYLQGENYDSEGVPWKRTEHTASGVVQAYVHDGTQTLAVVLVDVSDGRSCPQFLSTVPIEDMTDFMHDNAR